MQAKKTSVPSKNIQERPKVVTGSGRKKKQPSFWSNTPRTVLLVLFAISFGVVGFYLLRNSFADTGTTITVASWNAMKNNAKNTAKQTKKILRTANIVGLQEEHTAAQRDNIQALIQSSKYAVSPKATANNTSAAGVASYAIVWRQQEFTRVDEGQIGPVTPVIKGLRQRYITWVKLKQKATGKQFYVVNTHMIRDIEESQQDVEKHGKKASKEAKTKVDAYTGHMERLVGVIQKFQGENLPIFLTGDFAVNYRKDTGVVGTFPKSSLGAISMKSNWELTGLNGISPKARTYGKSGSRLIDYVFGWNVTSKSTSIGKSKLGSDHYPVFFTADLSTSSVDMR